jgi:hypothetical protein
VRIALSARGIDTGIDLFHLDLQGNGCWTYQSHAVEKAEGRLTEGDLAQFKSLYNAVDWYKEYARGGINRVLDHVEFGMKVEHDDGRRQFIEFSDELNNLSWPMRDLVHFLRHNVATGGDPVGPNLASIPPAAPSGQPRYQR